MDWIAIKKRWEKSFQFLLQTFIIRIYVQDVSFLFRVTVSACSTIKNKKKVLYKHVYIYVLNIDFIKKL